MKKVEYIIKNNFIILIMIGFIHGNDQLNNEVINVDITLYNKATIGQGSFGVFSPFINIKNNDTKTIKYMDIEIIAVNKVGDMLTPYTGSNVCKVTGPISYNEVYTIQGCKAYYDSYISDLKIRAIQVEFMDGSIINNPTKYYSFNRDKHNKEWSNKFIKDIMIIAIPVLALSLLLTI